MEKPEIILNLEKFYEVELFQTDLRGDFIKLNRSYDIDEYNQVIALNLSHLNISDITPLAEFESLTSLLIAHNSISNLKPLQSLHNLKFLNLSNNNLSDIKPLKNLNDLRKLNLNKNNISDIRSLRSCKNITHLYLNTNKVYDITSISSLKLLKQLDLSHNNLDDISSIQNLLNLEQLYCSNNVIDSIAALKKLSNLQEFRFENNKIFDLSPIYKLITKSDFTRSHNFYENPLIYPPTEIYLKGDKAIIEWFNSLFKHANRRINDCLKKQSKVLNLSYCGITDLTLLPNFSKCIHIEELILSNEWAEYSRNDWHKFSQSEINLRNNLYELPTQITRFFNLKKLIAGGDWTNERNVPKWRIKSTKNIDKLSNLKDLNLSNNVIYNIDNLLKLNKLENLYVNNNFISEIPSLGHNTKLVSLNVSNNYLENLDFLHKCTSLKMLDVHSNCLENIDGINDILLKLDKLVIDNNPIGEDQNWKLSKYENHLQTVKNYFSKRQTPGSKLYKMPVKVLLLGNHASGKSTLLKYLITSKKNRRIESNDDSTHIVKIEKYPKSKQRLPDIIFFDFGGQDYYHGIYKAFLTNGAINLVLWNEENNKNQIRKDKKGQLTRDFKKEYWLNQLKYHYSKSNIESESTSNDVVLLIQTFGDKDKKQSTNKIVEGISISNEFYVALNQEKMESDGLFKINLDYLENSLKYEIEHKRGLPGFNVEYPSWYGKFLSFIFNYNSENYITLKELQKQYKREIKSHETAEDIKQFLIEDLDQLHRQGLILYYKDYTSLNDIVWLNPAKLIDYIHTNILTQSILIENKGDIQESSFLKIAGDNNKIVKLLEIQKVIFHNEKSKKYIIPSFLPLSNDRNKDEYTILTFGFEHPNFVLKFKDFIPFGLVNQLICHFGNNPDSKHFWRDQLIFTIDNSVKVLIKLDFYNLEISVNLSHKKDDSLQLIEKYIFNCIIALYHDIPLLSYRDYMYNYSIVDDEKIIQSSVTVTFLDVLNRLPSDLYISIDNEFFVKADQINTSLGNHKIIAFSTTFFPAEKDLETGEEHILREICVEPSKELLIYNFQNFTNQKLKRLQKIFISYSKKDLKLINEFQNHLSALKRDGIVSTWFCTELLAGGEWDNDIARHFDESDIICFMISANLMKTDYIHKYEIAKAFARKKSDANFKIVPIILDFCSWSTSVNDLRDFTALPYTAKPVCDFDNRNMAWFIIVECIRIMISSGEQPIGDIWFNAAPHTLPDNLLRIYERIVSGEVDRTGGR